MQLALAMRSWFKYASFGIVNSQISSVSASQITRHGSGRSKAAGA